MVEERERFFSRLATIPGIRTMPSIGNWILVAVDNPSDLARKVNRRLEPGTISVPRHIQSAVRVGASDVAIRGVAGLASAFGLSSGDGVSRRITDHTRRKTSTQRPRIKPQPGPRGRAGGGTAGP